MAALDAGADGLAHLFLDDAISAADIALFVKKAKRRNAFIIPTFSILESMAGVSPADILDDPRAFHLLSREQRATLAAPFSRENAAHRLGVPMALTGPAQGRGAGAGRHRRRQSRHPVRHRHASRNGRAGQWRELSIPMASFAGIDPRALTVLAFNAGPKPGAYQFELADVRLTDD